MASGRVLRMGLSCVTNAGDATSEATVNVVLMDGQATTYGHIMMQISIPALKY